MKKTPTQRLAVTRRGRLDRDPSRDVAPGDAVALTTKPFKGRPCGGIVVAVFDDVVVCNVAPPRSPDRFAAWPIGQLRVVGKAFVNESTRVLELASWNVRAHFLQLLGVKPIPEQPSKEDDRPPATLARMRAMLSRVTLAMESIGHAHDLIHTPVESTDSIGWHWAEIVNVEHMLAYLDGATASAAALLKSCQMKIEIEHTDMALEELASGPDDDARRSS